MRPSFCPSLVLALLVSGCGAVASEVRAEHAPHDEPTWMSAVRETVARAEHDPLTYAHVETLTDAAGPRLAGSPGDRLAVAWGVARMNELGFANVRAEPVTVRVWTRGVERAEVLSPVPQPLAIAALGGSVGTPEGGIEGELLRVESLEALAALDPAAAAGRIVFVDRRMARARDGHGYGDTVGVRFRAAVAAARAGASAVLIRSVGTDDTRFPHTGVMGYVDDVERIPAAAMSNADADVVGRWMAAGNPVRVRLTLGCHDDGESTSANVIGEVVGSEHPEEIVLLGAHLDSWDLGRGAVDDGAGVAIVMEAARQILGAALRPRRTVRVVLFANEENGGAGADAYASEHASELGAHVMALESDFGDGAVYALRTPVPLSSSPPWSRIARLLEPLGVTWEDEPAHGGSDLESMHEAGGVPLVDARQDGTRYFDLHHTANDIASQVDRASLDQAMRAVLTIAYAASLDPELVRE